MSELKTIVTHSQCLTKYAYTRQTSELTAYFDRFTIEIEGEEVFMSIFFKEVQQEYMKHIEDTNCSPDTVHIYGQLVTISAYH